MKHIHIWQGSFHHYFKEKIGLKLSEDEESQHKPKSESSGAPRGAVVAPMAGLVVKVLVKNKTRVEVGQPVLVLEAMKMEVWLLCRCCKFLSLVSLFIYLGSYNQHCFVFFLACCKGTIIWLCTWATSCSG